MKDVRNRTSLDINELIAEALALTRGDLQRHRILVQAEPNAQVPQVKGLGTRSKREPRQPSLVA